MKFVHSMRHTGVTLLLVVLTSLSLTVASASAGNAAAANPGSSHTVANNPQGKATSSIYGKTGNGRRVTGNFTPVKFFAKDGRLKVRGLIQGVVHNRNGTTRSFAAFRTLRVKTINGTPARARTTTVAPRASCDVLNLVLAPLDLNLLGLTVHLDRVVLNIVAKSGAGQLLGNLLCAVAGLLDGGLSGLLGRVSNLLNRILGSPTSAEVTRHSREGSVRWDRPLVVAET